MSADMDAAHLAADMLAEVPEIPDCDFHALSGEIGIPAAYDAETKSGEWGFMCTPCFEQHGVGLGLGVGQRLVLKGDPLVRLIGTVGDPDPTSDEEGAPSATDQSDLARDAKIAARILWGFYLLPLLVAAACFVGLVITGRDTYLACGLMACLAAWFVTDHLDEARFEAKIQARAES